MSAGGCLDAGRFDSDAIVQMKTGLLDILQFHITVTVTYYLQLQTWDANIRRPRKGGLLIFL